MSLRGLSDKNAARVKSTVEWSERLRGKGTETAPRSGSGQIPILRYAKVITCALATGYGTIQFYYGNRADLTLDTDIEVKCGMSTWYRADMKVVVQQVAAPDYAWEVVAMLEGPTFYKDPLTDGSTLASVQDDPDPEGYCSDTVTVP